MKRQSYSCRTEIDPFYTYLQAETIVGPRQAFLLEAGREDDSALYQMSLIGVCPVLEVQIRDGLVTVTALPELTEHVERLGAVTMDAKDIPVWPSAVEGKTLQFRPTDVMTFLDALRQSLHQALAPDMSQPFSAGFLGYVGYDAVRYLETLPQTTLDDRNLPDVRLAWHAAVIQFAEGGMSLYRQDDEGLLQGNQTLSDTLDALETYLQDIAEQGVSRPAILLELDQQKSARRGTVHYDVSEQTYCDSVEKGIEYIRAGDIFQVVLSTRMRIEGGLHPYAAYDELRKLNPSPYMFVAEYEGMRLFGASPEVQFRSIARRAEMKPIAGTSRGRGGSSEEDAALVAALQNDAKETAEHVMLVDLCRNDLGRVAVTGSVHVPDFMVVERYSHLYHLVSRVEAVLRDDVSVFHALLATFPNGTLSGAPKIRAMEIIDELETVRRGPYGGFIGMIDADANANTAIVIRTVVEVDDAQYVQVGAGIVLDSQPEREWQECHHKAGALLDVLTGMRRAVM